MYSKIIDALGYVRLTIKNHPRAKPPHYRVYEHIVVMENKLGRYLKPNERVHHKDKNRSNNRIENLELFESNGLHLKHEITKDKTNRFCAICNNNKTIASKKGIEYWYKYNESFICQNCYRCIKYREKRERIMPL